MIRDELSRLAAVETRVDSLGIGLDRVHARLDVVGSDVREIRDSLHKQRGFISGVFAAFTFVWTAVGGLLAWFWMR